MADQVFGDHFSAPSAQTQVYLGVATVVAGIDAWRVAWGSGAGEVGVGVAVNELAFFGASELM